MKWVACWLLAALLAAPCSANGSTDVAPRVAIVKDPTEDSRHLGGRLRAELQANGFAVADVQDDHSSTNQDVTWLAGLLRRTSAAAAVRLDWGRSVVVVCFIVPRTQTRCRDVSFRDVPDGVVALRVAELLRAELLEPPTTGVVATPPAEPLSPSPSAPMPLTIPPPVEHPIALGLGVAGVTSPGGIPAAVVPTVEIRLGLVSPFNIFAFANVPVWTSHVTVDGEGSADIQLGMAGLGTDLALPLGAAWGLTLRPGAGALLSYQVMKGNPQAPYRGQSEVVFSTGPFLRCGLRLKLTDHLSAGVDVLAAVALGSTVVRFARQAVARWGQPVAVGQLSAEWTF